MNEQNPVAEPANTRSHIASVATKLFAHQGFDGTSVRDIVEAAGVTKPVLYYYFKSKEDLFVTLIHEAYSTFIRLIEETTQVSAPFPDKLKKIIHLYFEDCEQNEEEDLIRLIFMTFFGPRRNRPPESFLALEQRHFEILRQFFQEGIEQGYGNKDSAEENVMHFWGEITIYLLLLLRGGPMPDRFEDHIYMFMLRGIACQTISSNSS
ncbi:MAG: TetR/AcrR family transcriptional regulator [Candidatus Omnitrophota bacterium]|jgi:AcrR family transcriptional regulator|nr:MAG: TetR/AcrR family transcriptional regulator [Candidatus Omnitrophota bacterium]